MEFSKYIEPELLITVPVLYVLGMMIKKSSIDDKWIPIILGVMGIVLVIAYKLTASFPQTAGEFFGLLFAGITQGILCAAGSVYANNIVKQMSKNQGNKDEKDDQSDSKGNS